MRRCRDHYTYTCFWRHAGLGEKALKKLDSAAVAAEVEELVNAAEAARAEFPAHEGIAKVDSIVAELQVSMLDFLQLEERRRIKREKERERKERLKAEGKLLTDKEKERLRKQEAYLKAIGKDGEGGAAAGAAEGGEVKKKVVYGKRKPNNKSKDAAGGEQADDAGAAAATDAGVAAEAPSAEPVEGAHVPAEEAEADEDWMNIDESKLGSGLAGDAEADSEEEEEEFVARPAGELSSKLAALAAASASEKAAAEKRKEETLEKLAGFKAKKQVSRTDPHLP